MTDSLANHSLEIEEQFFGNDIGIVKLYQTSYPLFYQKCRSNYIENVEPQLRDETVGDNTGLRIYSGCHVAIRLLTKLSLYIDFTNKNAIELGCGIGAFGLVSLINNRFKRLTLTDGQNSSLNIVKQNWQLLCNSVQHLRTGSSLDTIVNFELLTWGSENELNLTERNLGVGNTYDIVLGCELMYYRTNIADLLTTVLKLINLEDGIFIHCHLFRRIGITSYAVQ